MDPYSEYERASRDAETARLRRTLAIRAMLAGGQSQSEVAKRLGVTQPAVSYQAAPERTNQVYPHDLIAAASELLRGLTKQAGFSRLAVFGSAARGDDRVDSDIDLLVATPKGVDFLDFIKLKDAFNATLARPVDLISYAGLDNRIDQDILREAVLL